MDFHRFTEKVQDAIGAARTLATRRGHQLLDVEHLFSTLLEQDAGLAVAILLKAGVDLENLHRRLGQELDRLPTVTVASTPVDQLYITGRLQQLLGRADEEAKQLRDDYISVVTPDSCGASSSSSAI